MVKSTRRGFTLVELLVTIILLGVIGGIIIYNIMNITTNSKETEYERFITKIKSAAATYADVNPETFKDLFVNKAFLYIQIRDLIENGFLDEDLVNPYTDEPVNPNELIKANLNTDNGALMFTYPVSPDEKNEQFLLALSDYVVYREPYDCMQGRGTYQLALSDENGDLIILDDTTISKYQFTCEYPKEFKTYSGYVDGQPVNDKWKKGKYVEKAGTYEITYKWVTESGTPKQAKRTLRVLPKARPAFSTIEADKTWSDNGNVGSASYANEKVVAYALGTLESAGSTEQYVPKVIDAAHNTWRILRYKPYIEGVDPETTYYSVSKTALQQGHERGQAVSGSEVKVVNNSKNYDQMFDVDDGITRYDIDCLVVGRYNKDYSYRANNTVVMASKLIVPVTVGATATNAYVSTSPEGWALEKNLFVENKIHSPVGVLYYEYSLVNRSNDDLQVNRQYTFKNDVKMNAAIDGETFPVGDGGVYKQSSAAVDIGNDKCIDKRFEFYDVYVRARNKYGYLGDWSKTNIYLTSDLVKIINSDAKCNKNGDTCYYKEKRMRFIINATHPTTKVVTQFRYIVLERDNGNMFKVTVEGVGEEAEPIKVENNKAIEADCCDMHLSGTVDYRTVLLDRIFKATKKEWTKLQEAGVPLDTMTKHLYLQRWDIDTTKIVKKLGWGDFGRTISYEKAKTTYKTTSFFGNASLEDVKKYKYALYVPCSTASDCKDCNPDPKCAYWTTDNYVDQKSTVLKEENGAHTQTVYYYTADLYVITSTVDKKNNQVIDNSKNGLWVKKDYAAEKHPTKPLATLYNLEACKYEQVNGIEQYTIALDRSVVL